MLRSDVAAFLLLTSLAALVALAALRAATRHAPEPERGFAAVVINMDRHADRLRRFGRRAAAAGLAFERVPGVDSAEVDASTVVAPRALREMRRAVRRGYRLEHRDLTPGSVGCYLSHLGAFERHLRSERRDDALLVFEDDAAVPRDFWARVRALRLDDHEWDVMLLGSLNPAGEDELSAEPTIEIRRFYLTHAYAITPRGMRRVLAGALPITAQYDSFLADLAERGELAVRAASDDVVVQDGLTETSIQTLGVSDGASYF